MTGIFDIYPGKPLLKKNSGKPLYEIQVLRGLEAIFLSIVCPKKTTYK